MAPLHGSSLIPRPSLTAVARLVAEAPTPRRRRVASGGCRCATRFRSSGCTCCASTARSRSCCTSSRATGELEVTGHRIADAGAAHRAAVDADARSRIICTVRQGTRVHGALWLTSTPEDAFTRRAPGADGQRRRPAGAGARSTTRSRSTETLRRERIDSLERPAAHDGRSRSTSGRSSPRSPRSCAAACRTTSWR